MQQVYSPRVVPAVSLILPPLLEDAHCRDLLGPRIGEGVSRDVHLCAQDATWVVKYERRAPYRSNMTEWTLWQALRDVPEHRARFARLLAISESGAYLIMEYLRPLPADMSVPAVPAYLGDVKREQFGLGDDGVKCFDYGDLDLAAALRLAPLVG